MTRLYKPRRPLCWIAVGVAAFGFLLAGPSQGEDQFDPMPLFLAEKAEYSGGPFKFAVIGECKDSCASGGLDIALYIHQNYPDITFAVTMGDLISYQGPASDWDDLAENIGGFMDRYATFPVLGDQERMGRPEEKYYQFYNLPRVFRPDNSTWSLGNTVFLMLSYYDPPNFDGGRYTTPSASVYDLETGEMTTVAEVLLDALTTDKNVITFSHAQYLDPAGSPGHKYYCCYSGQTRNMFEASSIRLHFQSDNPGLTTMESNGIHYVRASGAWSYDPAFFALVTVDGKSITVEFPNTDGGVEADPVVISYLLSDGFDLGEPFGWARVVVSLWADGFDFGDTSRWTLEVP